MGAEAKIFMSLSTIRLGELFLSSKQKIGVRDSMV